MSPDTDVYDEAVAAAMFVNAPTPSWRCHW